MRSLHPAAAAAAVTLGACVGLVAAATSASADPFTSDGSLGSASIAVTYSDTVLDSGELIQATIEFTNITGAPIDYAYRVGSSVDGFADLLQLEGCDFEESVDVNCQMVLSGTTFEAAVNDLPPGVTTVSASFSVRPGVVDGEYPIGQLFRGSESGVDLNPPLVFTVGESEADVDVSLDATAGPLLTSQITYEVSAANQGPSDVDSATIVVDLPTQVGSVSNLPAGCAYSATADEVTCATGAISNGDEYTSTFRANLGLLSIGTLPATATRTASSPTDPNPANDTSTANCTVVTSLIILCN